MTTCEQKLHGCNPINAFLYVCMYFYVHKVKWIKNAGYTYKKDAIVLLSRSPVFAMIKEVYLLNDNIIGFRVTKLLYQNFNSHLHAHCHMTQLLYCLIHSSSPIQCTCITCKENCWLSYHIKLTSVIDVFIIINNYQTSPLASYHSTSSLQLIMYNHVFIIYKVELLSH